MGPHAGSRRFSIEVPTLRPPSYPTLHPYGFTALRAEQLPAGALPARVVRHDGASVLAVTPQGPEALPVTTRTDPQPTVGDWLAVDAPHDRSAGPMRIRAVLPRTSLLRRQSADGTGPQDLAANVDLVLVTCGIDRPIRAGRIHRVATQAWDAGATPVLVLTKVSGPRAADLDLPRLELEHPGLRVIVTSALEGVGLDEVRELIGGRTAALMGESGAGKSTLANALLGRDEAATGAVRPGDAKGRHTTTSRQLHVLPGAPGGAIIDTPGIRAVGLFADAQSVDASFADIRDLATSCRFSDCGHRGEPGCAVLGAIESGVLAQPRYDSWLRLQRELASAALRSSTHQARAHAKRFSRMAREVALRKRES